MDWMLVGSLSIGAIPSLVFQFHSFESMYGLTATGDVPYLSGILCSCSLLGGKELGTLKTCSNFCIKLSIDTFCYYHGVALSHLGLLDDPSTVNALADHAYAS